MSYQGQKLKKSKQLYRHITAVVQDAEKQFIRTTPAEELNLSSLSSENQAKVQEALDLFGLADKMDSSLFHLSGGQKNHSIIGYLDLRDSCHTHGRTIYWLR